MVCNSCGFTEHCVYLNQLSRSDRKQLRDVGAHDRTENIRDQARLEFQDHFISGKTGHRYKHVEYFLERVSQWAMREKEISDDDWESILIVFHDWCLSKGLRYIIPTRAQLSQNIGRIPGTVCLSKTDVRDILNECQNRFPVKEVDFRKPIKINYRSPVKEVDFGKPTKNNFCRKYLEKWLSIRYRLCGVKSTYYRCPPWLLECLKEYFELVVAAFNRVIYQSDGRKRMIGYNFVFRRLFDLFGFTFCCDDFPLKDTKSNQDNILMWKKVCKYYQWPYINSDYDGGDQGFQ